MKRLIIHVSGKVQGVFYRASTRETADRLGIRGLVRNEPDGSVYIEAEGDDPELGEFVQWCKKGPRHAEVSTFAADDADVIGYVGFRIVG